MQPLVAFLPHAFSCTNGASFTLLQKVKKPQLNTLRKISHSITPRPLDVVRLNGLFGNRRPIILFGNHSKLGGVF
jgi:hypothetical protein